MARHRWPLVAHHTDVRLIAGGPLATLFDSIGSSVVIHHWRDSVCDKHHEAGGPTHRSVQQPMTDSRRATGDNGCSQWPAGQTVSVYPADLPPSHEALIQCWF